MLAVLTALALQVTLADPSPPQLNWSAPASCPDERWVRARVEAYLGERLAEPRDEPFEATGAIIDGADGLQLTLQLRAGAGKTEELHRADSCEALAKLAAIKVALTLDPEAFIRRYEEVEQRAAELEATPPATTPPPPAAAPPEPPRPVEPPQPASTPAPASPEPEPPAAIVGWLNAGGGIALGVTPGLGSVAQLAGGVFVRRWRLELRALALPPTRAPFAPEQDVFVRVSAYGGATLACFVPTASFVEFPLCAGLELLAVRARGVGTVPEGSALRPLPSALVGAAAVFRWGRWGLFVRPELGVGLSLPRFAIGAQVVHSIAPVSMRALAGVELRLGPAAQ